jgi:hypothetical protein
LLPEPGSYTAFADVAPEEAESMTLRLPLTAEGEVAPDESFEPSTVAITNGYRVELHGHATAGETSHIEVRVTKNGLEVQPDPYLGAAGHLVAIRADDLDYLHVHPMESSEVGLIPFMMHASGPGLYRLFLQFQHEGSVRTADFTVEVPIHGSDTGV